MAPKGIESNWILSIHSYRYSLNNVRVYVTFFHKTLALNNLVPHQRCFFNDLYSNLHWLRIPELEHGYVGINVIVGELI